FADAPADFGVLMSSLAPVLGGVGSAGSAAADRFLDAWSSGGDRLISVGWDGSAFPGAGPTGEPLPGDRQEERRLSPEQGAEVLGLVLRSDVPSRLAVSTTDLERRVQRQSAGPEPVPPVLTASGRPSGDELKSTLAKLWSEVLRTEVDQYDRSLFDINDDSLLAVRLARRIGEELGVPLRTIDLLRNPTIDLLAARLDPHRDR
ncbi:beta-ketoacyl reductase, partial [Streptomyces sp. W16]|uniref:beta-ketoacyl reductase n=1 Tax=Streptomyces sp. W16 TaxID=3076631 RepID=UPI00295BB53B